MWDVGLAQMFKERDNKINIGPCVGKVVGIGPLKISILGGEAILDETIHEIYICDNLLDTYTREYKDEGNIKFQDTDCGTTNKVHDGGEGASPHNHIVENLSIDTKYNTIGTIVFTDTLKKDDEVLLIPAENQQVFFIVGKVRKVGD